MVLSNPNPLILSSGPWYLPCFQSQHFDKTCVLVRHQRFCQTVRNHVLSHDMNKIRFLLLDMLNDPFKPYIHATVSSRHFAIQDLVPRILAVRIQDLQCWLNTAQLFHHT